MRRYFCIFVLPLISLFALFTASSISATDYQNAGDRVAAATSPEVPYGAPIEGTTETAGLFEYSSVTATILDGSNGDTLSARCNVVDSFSYSRYPPADSSLYHTSEGGYFYSPGTFSVTVLNGPAIIRIGHGPEYLPVVDTIDVFSDTTLIFQLEKLVAMEDLQWYSGDCHVHIHHSGGVYTLQPEHAFFMGNAEGLNVVNSLDQDYYFTGDPDSCSTPKCIVYMSEEYRSGTYGHMGLLGLNQLVSPLWSMWWPSNMQIADLTHLQPGALVISAHPISTDDFSQIDGWPGSGLARELPVDIITGRIDGFEVMSYNNYRPGGIELEMWYRLLNCGFKLPACAGTDAAMNRAADRPLGGFRTYVHIPYGGFTFDNWLKQLGNGKTFVTNGPLITRFDILGLMPGETFVLPRGSWRINGQLSVHCAYPLERAEIIRNGNVAVSFPLETG